MDKKIGHYSFIGGVILAVVLGVVGPLDLIPVEAGGWLVSLMVILGLVVGLMNIGTKEKKEFMMVSTVLIIASFAGGASNILAGVQIIGQYIGSIFVNILGFVIPAVVVVGLRDIWEMGQNA